MFQALRWRRATSATSAQDAACCEFCRISHCTLETRTGPTSNLDSLARPTTFDCYGATESQAVRVPFSCSRSHTLAYMDVHGGSTGEGYDEAAAATAAFELLLMSLMVMVMLF